MILCDKCKSEIKKSYKIDKSFLKLFCCVENLLNKFPGLEKEVYQIDTVINTENIEFVVGRMCIVKCVKGQLKFQSSIDESKWDNVNMTRDYLNARYLRLEGITC